MVFAFGSRVGDDAAAGLDIRFAVLEQHSAQRDAGVVVAVEAEVTDGAGVGAAFAFFEFVEDLHRADLGGAGDGSSRERGPHDIKGRASAGKLTGDVSDDVHHVAIALDGHEVGDLHAAVFGDATDIVAGEIHEHEVLGALLGIGHEVGGIRIIFLRSGSTAACAGDRTDFNKVAGETDVDFRRTAHERVSTRTAETKHVGRRINEAQGAVEVECVVVKFGFEPLREHDLEDVARADVFMGLVDHGVVFLAGRVRSRWRGSRGGFRENRLEGDRLS